MVTSYMTHAVLYYHTSILLQVALAAHMDFIILANQMQLLELFGLLSHSYPLHLANAGLLYLQR